jgi:nucleotide-binding universal stress UspA family protein
MSKIHSILAATDLSTPARHAAERAAQISQQHGAPLCLLHVANLAPLQRLRQMLTSDHESVEQKVLSTARERLQSVADALHARFGVNVDDRLVVGSLITEIRGVADELASGLLVCGARGESLLRHLLLGSTAERMLSNTTRPLLVVKQAPHQAYKTVLVPVDFSASSIRAIRQARMLAPQAQLIVLHVFEVPFEGHLRYANVDEDTINHYRVAALQEASQRLQALCHDAGLSAADSRQVVIQGDPATRILEQEMEQDCDLIVQGKHGESAVEHLILGSVTKQVLVESQADVLVSV